MQDRLIHADELVYILDIPRPKGFYFPGESHDFWEGVFVYKGKVAATADERVYQLEKGKLLLHKPMEFHRIWEVEDSDPRLVNISFRISGEVAKRLENTCFDLDSGQQEHLWEVINAFKRVKELGRMGIYNQEQQVDWTEQTDWQGRMAENKAAVLLEAFLLELAEAGEHSQRVLSVDESRYARIVNMMKENCHRMLSVEELARLCEMSVSNMKRIFACFSDVGVAKFFMSLKMRRAMELLDAGVTAKEVADMLDFEETSYFYTVFKRETGMTPTQYRRRR